MEEFITVFDEYMVENTHSIIRRSTNLLDPVPVLIKKVKDVFANREAQANFRETFGHTKNHTFSKNQMRYFETESSIIDFESYPLHIFTTISTAVQNCR